MGVLVEQSEWPAGIYRLSTTDKVLGGLGGISNRQPLQLANRTLYLRDALDALGRQVAALREDVDTLVARPQPVEAPGNLTVASRELARIQLTWDAVTDAHRYDIRTRSGSGDWGVPTSAGTDTALWVSALTQRSA